jgi:hypothetical protein
MALSGSLLAALTLMDPRLVVLVSGIVGGSGIVSG